MENRDFIKRIEDLSHRCERTCSVTSTGFLTPAEQYELKLWAAARPDCRLVLSGGAENCQRQIGFFLPYYMEEDALEIPEYIRCVRVKAYFGKPAHRDYMGAALGLGIKREWIGDFLITGDTAYILCLPSVETLLLDELTKVGRWGVKTSPCPLSEVPAAEIKVKKLTFTVKSLRLDAVAGSLFGISRTAAAELIRMGAASLNYAPCLHVDAAVSEGDIISLRGYGKGAVTQVGGRSRKDRLFIEAEIYL